MFHIDHIFATTMQLMSKSTDFMTNNVLVLRVYVVTICSHICTIGRVEPNCSCRCDYNLQLI